MSWTAFVNWFKKGYPYMFMGIGVIVYILAFFDIFYTDANQIIKDVGKVMLGSGVFAALVKTDLFLTLFRKEVSSIREGLNEELVRVKGEISTLRSDFSGTIFFDRAYLSRRTDLRQIWTNVSRALYKEKFPEICDDIEKAITEHYFPTDHDFYYTDYRYEIKLKNKPDDFLELKETLTFTMKLGHINRVYLEAEISANLIDPEDKVSKIAIEEIYVNDRYFDFNKHLVMTTSTDKIVGILKAPLEGEKEYRIRMVRNKIYSSKDQRYMKMFLFKKFCKTLTVDVQFPEGMKIAFYQQGTVNSYKDASPEKTKKTRIIKHSDGIIFPAQGFLLSIKNTK
jgi:hypothetical protein